MVEILKARCQKSYFGCIDIILIIWISVYINNIKLNECILLFRARHTCKKIGRLDFSLREHEGEVKAWQGDIFAQECGFFHFFFCIWSVSLLISCLYLSYLTLNLCFVFVLLLSFDLIFIDFRFIDFCFEICQWHLNVRFLPPISYVPMIAMFKT